MKKKIVALTGALLLASVAFTQDYIFKFNEAGKYEVHVQFATDMEPDDCLDELKTWMGENRIVSLGEQERIDGVSLKLPLGFNIRFKYNPLIRTAFGDDLTCDFSLTVKNGIAYVDMTNLVLIYKVEGVGAKEVPYELHEYYKRVQKIQKNIDKTNANETLTPKEKKSKLKDLNEELEEARVTLEDCDKEIKSRLEKLKLRIEE